MTVTNVADLPTIINCDEAAELLRCGRTKIYEMARAGELPGTFRIGSSVRIERDVLIAAIRTQAGGQREP